MHTLNRVSSNHMRDTYSRGNFELHLLRVSIHVTAKMPTINSPASTFCERQLHAFLLLVRGKNRHHHYNTTTSRRRRRRRRQQQQQRRRRLQLPHYHYDYMKRQRSAGTIKQRFNNQLVVPIHVFLPRLLFCFHKTLRKVE